MKQFCFKQIKLETKSQNQFFYFFCPTSSPLIQSSFNKTISLSFFTFYVQSSLCMPLILRTGASYILNPMSGLTILHLYRNRSMLRTIQITEYAFQNFDHLSQSYLSNLVSYPTESFHLSYTEAFLHFQLGYFIHSF